MPHSSLRASGTQAVFSSHLRAVPGLLHGPLPPLEPLPPQPQLVLPLPPHPPLVLPHPQPLAPAALFASWELTEPLAYLTVKVKVYAESHQRATRKGFQLVITPARAPPKSEKEKQQRLARIQGVASHAILPAPSPPEASRSTSNPPIRSPIVTVVV